jgi:CO/xanthine dehydrogenase Mo-binding subunit
VHPLILEYLIPMVLGRGMAEMPFMPLAPAVMAAVHDATGVWFHEFPLTPERVLRARPSWPL